MQTGLSKPHCLPGVQTEVMLGFLSPFYILLSVEVVIFTLCLYSGMKSSHLMPFPKASWTASRPVNGW